MPERNVEGKIHIRMDEGLHKRHRTSGEGRGSMFRFSICLDDAIDLLPLAKLHQIAKKYLDIKRLRPDSETKTKANLLAAVKDFDKMLAVARKNATPEQGKALAASRDQRANRRREGTKP